MGFYRKRVSLFQQVSGAGTSGTINRKRTIMDRFRKNFMGLLILLLMMIEAI